MTMIVSCVPADPFMGHKGRVYFDWVIQKYVIPGKMWRIEL